MIPPIDPWHVAFVGLLAFILAINRRPPDRYC